MDSKLYRELLEAYMNVYASEDVLDEAKHEGEKEEEEDTKKKSSKKGEDEEEDEDEMEEMDEAVENLDEISANLALTASQKADEERRKASLAGDKATAAKKAAQASRLYKSVGPRRTKERMKAMGEEVDIFDEVIEFLCVEGYAETLEEAEWMMANIIDEEAIDIILGEAITSEKGKAKAAEMIAKRSTPSGRAKSGQGASVAQIKHISRANVDNLGGTPPNPKIAKNPVKSRSYGGTGNKAARRAGLTPTREKPNAWKEEFVDEAQEARNNPEKYEREQSKKTAPVRGEKTPMPPRGDKRREDFEKWYRANVR